MAQLEGFQSFGGANPVTASIRNALAYQGVSAPHTGEPYTEALLMGIAGGLTFGYFVFQYEGFDPQVNILTRNTFHNYGWDAITERLGISQDLRHGTNPNTGRKHLLAILGEGDAPIAWADIFSFPYESSEFGDGMWAMTPMIVTSYDEAAGTAEVADRAEVPHPVGAEALDAARGRVKKDKYRVVSLGDPEDHLLPVAVETGLRETIALFEEKPPKGSANNFGFKAFAHLSAMLRKDSGKGTWRTQMPNGRALYSALMTAYKYSLLHYKDAHADAERSMFADFLVEASTILDKPGLTEAADQYRTASASWAALGERLLPAGHTLLDSTRNLMVKRSTVFREQGLAGIEELKKIDGELDALNVAANDFDLTDVERDSLLAGIADAVDSVAENERQALDTVKKVLGEKTS